jgi:hypothetical protein
VWTTDRERAYESFWECFEAWEERAAKDPKIDMKKLFNTPELARDEDDEGVSSAI